MHYFALIAFCIAALAAPPLRADQCSELVGEYNAGQQRLDDLNRRQREKGKKMLSDGVQPSGKEMLEFVCTDVRLRLLEMRRELETVKRFFPECAAHLPRPPDGKVCNVVPECSAHPPRPPSGMVCDIVCRETIVTDSEKWVRKNCE